MTVFSDCRRFLKALLPILVLFLFVLTICAVLPHVFRRFPIETLIVATILVVSGLSVVVYMGELVVIGWIMDFLSEVYMPRGQARPAPLEYERVGEIIVVKLRDNIITLQQCQSVQKQLKRLIDEHHCDFVLDFLHAEKISKRFRGVMVQVMKAAHREAGKLASRIDPLHCLTGRYSECSMTGNVRSRKCPSTMGMDGSSSVRFPLESEHSPV